MTDLLWTLDDLIEFTKSDDPEVRFWAVDRLVRHYPTECCDAIVGFLLDDHDATPAVVARHLGQHGEARHHAVLVRGFRLLRGLTPGLCLQALTRLAYPGVLSLATDALKRGDLNEPALAIIVGSLAELGTDEAETLVREILSRRPDLLAEPAALRGALRITPAAELQDLMVGFLQALQRQGAHRAAEAFRTLMDSLHIDDASWCFRTGPSGHIELRKTIKAVDSGYDCDILAAMGETTIKHLAQKFRAGGPAEIIRSLADWTVSSNERIARSTDRADTFAERVEATTRALASGPILEEAARLGRQYHQWLLGFHLSAAFATARGLNPGDALRRARGDLGRLLELAEIETAHLLDHVPAVISVVCREDESAGRQAQEWCLRMLEAQGPFFPKVMALEILGELRAVHFIPEMMEYLSDENSYVYSAAERALSRMGETIILPAVNRIESGAIDPDAAHSVLVLLCDLGTSGAFEVVMRHFDWFMEAVGPGTTAEWASLFGMEELIEPLRDWLDEDPALVGQGLLLLGAMHNVEIPEEDEILRAIEDERARQAAGEEPGQADEGIDGDGGNYLM